MKTWRAVRNQRGITLIAVVMVVLAIGLIAYFAGAIAVKLQEIAKERNTVNRMSVVRTALEQYYRAHENLPDPTTTTANYTPAYSVAVGDLSLEQKFRVDAWGQLYHYNIGATRPEESCNSPAGSIYDLLGLVVDGVPVAAVLVSAGPNQIFDSFDPTSPPATYPATGYQKVDDVYVSINLSQQAQEIALGELNTLAKKAYAWDCTCNPSPVPLTLAGLIAQFSLSDQFFHDPWGQCYAADTSGIIPRFLSTGPDRTAGTTDDITVPSMNKCCTDMPDSANPNPTTPLHYWNFNTSGDPGTFAPSGGVTPITQTGNTAMDFNGTTGYAYAGYPDPASSDPSSPPYSTYPYLFNFHRTDAFSIVAWIKTSANGTIVSKMTSATPPKGYRVYISGGLVYFEICSIDDDNNSYTIRARGTTSVTDGECHHIAVTYNGDSTNGGLEVYVDDGPAETTGRTGGPLEGSISNAVPFQLSGYDGAHDLYTGILDDVALYDVVLLATEINDIWDGAIDDNLAEWPFCDVCSYVLPDSDQTSGYTGTFGEDNDYNAAFNTLSYTDNGDGTITDENTCLMWEQKTNDNSIHDRDNTYSWANAQSVFIAGLNAANFANYNDWRLPTVTELMSILNYENRNPAIAGTFVNTRSSNYWTSTTNAASTGQAWCVNFNYGGHTRNNGKGNSNYVRAVRGPALTWGQQFQDNANGTVTDLVTGLIWQKSTSPTQRTWTGAMNYCESLTLASQADWRLPNIKEVQSLVDHAGSNPAINLTAFPGTRYGSSDHYWSSTTNDNDDDNAWTVYFRYGEVRDYDKSDNDEGYVRAVRGPQ